MTYSVQKIGDSGYPEEDGIIVLDDMTFKRALDEFPLLIVKFYAPWCGVSKEKYGDYIKLAAHFKDRDMPIHTAKIDGEANPIAHADQKIMRYPTVLLFMSGKPILNHDLFRLNQTIETIDQRIGEVTLGFDDEDEYNDFKIYHKFMVVFSGDLNSQEFKEYKHASIFLDETPFYYLKYISKKSRALKGLKPRITIHRSYNEEEIEITFKGEFSAKAITEFVKENRYPHMLRFNQDAVLERLYEHHHPGITLFSDDHDLFDKEFTELAQKYHNDKDFKGLTFIRSKRSTGMENKFANYLGVRKDDSDPVVFISHSKDNGNNTLKFKLEGEVTKASVEKFIHDWKDGKLTPYYIKQDPIEFDRFLKVQSLTGHNLRSFIKDSKTYVFVTYGAKWCVKCQKSLRLVEDLAWVYKRNYNIRFAKFDAFNNELEFPEFEGDLPYNVLYSPGNSTAPVRYEDELYRAQIEQFLEDNLGSKFRRREPYLF